LQQKLARRDGEPRKGARYEIAEDGILLLAATAQITACSNGSEDPVTASLQQPFRVAVAAVTSDSNPAEGTTQSSRTSEQEAAPAQAENVTGEQIVERLREVPRVATPKGNGRIWRLWTTQIGVLLDRDPDRVTFFTTLQDMAAIVPLVDEGEEGIAEGLL
jgi:hypothetical protein